MSAIRSWLRNQIQARVLVAVAIAVAAAAALWLVAYRDVAPDPGGDVAAVPLSLSLALASDTGSVDSAIHLTVTLGNEGDTTLTVARPAIVPNLVYLEVTHDNGEEVPFDGPWLTLKPLRQELFAELKPGESVTHELDLAEFYRLPSGGYTVVAIYSNPYDGSQHGLRAVLVTEEAAVRSSGVPLRVR